MELPPSVAPAPAAATGAPHHALEYSNDISARDVVAEEAPRPRRWNRQHKRARFIDSAEQAATYPRDYMLEALNG